LCFNSCFCFNRQKIDNPQTVNDSKHRIKCFNFLYLF
jgi:hypothetical protein